MSWSQSDMNLMGSTNSYWGVCGFTSTFHSMYELNPGKRPLILGAGIATKVLAEIKTYLMMLKAEGNTALLNEIQKFTRTFPTVNGCNFSTFTIDNYIRLINSAVGKSESEIKSDGYYSIGMPPAAVVDYVRRMWGYKAELKKGDTGADGIIGVKKDKRKLYDGLCHYMYRSGGKIYSWGQCFGSVTAANALYRVICVVKITPP